MCAEKTSRPLGRSGPGYGLAMTSAIPMLAVTLDVDGRRLQDSNTSQMLYRIDELIEYASARMPLDVGDIIATGTPVGVAANHEPPAWLMPGMRVSARLEGLGQLDNIVAERG